MRALPWILIALFVLIAFTTRSAGLMVLSWLMVFAAGTWAMLQLVDARINANARHSSSLLGPQELAALKQRAERQLKARTAAADAAARPAGAADIGGAAVGEHVGETGTA